MGLIMLISWVGIAVSTLAFSLVGGSWRRVYFLTCALAFPVLVVYFTESGTRWTWLNFLFLYPAFLLQTAMATFPLSALLLLYRHIRRRAAERAKAQSPTPGDSARRVTVSAAPMKERP